VTGADMTAVTNQAAEFARLTLFINEAWMDLQMTRTDWKWMRNSMTFPTVAGQATYTLAQIDRFQHGLDAKPTDARLDLQPVAELEKVHGSVQRKSHPEVAWFPVSTGRGWDYWYAAASVTSRSA